LPTLLTSINDAQRPTENSKEHSSPTLLPLKEEAARIQRKREGRNDGGSLPTYDDYGSGNYLSFCNHPEKHTEEAMGSAAEFQSVSNSRICQHPEKQREQAMGLAAASTSGSDSRMQSSCARRAAYAKSKSKSLPSVERRAAYGRSKSNSLPLLDSSQQQEGLNRGFSRSGTGKGKRSRPNPNDPIASIWKRLDLAISIVS